MQPPSRALELIGAGSETTRGLHALRSCWGAGGIAGMVRGDLARQGSVAFSGAAHGLMMCGLLDALRCPKRAVAVRMASAFPL
jgi:hypothetical protein